MINKITRNRMRLIFLIAMLCLTVISHTVSAYTYPKSIREREEDGFDMDDLIRSLPIAVPLMILFMIPCIVFTIRFKISHDTVKNNLLPGEKIIFRDRFLFATNKRLIRCLSRSKFEFLEYSKISSITPRKLSIARTIGCIAMISLGVLLIIIGTIAYIGPEFHSGTTLIHTKGDLSISIVGWVFGAMSIIMAFTIINSYLQVQSSNINKNDQAKWKFHIRGKKAKELIYMIKMAQKSPITLN